MPIAKALHEVSFVELAAARQAVGESERHGCVVCPLTRRQLEWAATDYIGDRRVAIARLELERGPERIAYSKPKHRSDGPVGDLFARWAGLKFHPWLLVEDIRDLCWRLDCTGPRCTHLIDRMGWLDTQFNQHSRGDGARAAQPTLAMD